MERCEAPGGVIDPGPAPGGDEGPVAIAIRHPAAFHGRIPDLAIFRRAIPTSCFRERLAARHFLDHRRWRVVTGRHHAGRRRIGLQHRPAGQRTDAALERAAAGDLAGLLVSDHQGDVVARNLGLAARDTDQRRVFAIASSEVILALVDNGDGAARGADLQGIARLHAAHGHKNAALRERRGHGVVGQLIDVELGAFAHHNAGAGDVEIGAAARFGPEGAAG